MSLYTNNSKQEEITEPTNDKEENMQADRELQTALDRSKILYDQAMSGNDLLIGQNEKMSTNIVDGNKDKKPNKFKPKTDICFRSLYHDLPNILSFQTALRNISS